MQKTIIGRAIKDQSDAIAILVGELLQEIMDRIGIDVFHFDLEETKERLVEFIEHEKNFVFVAQENENGELIGFVTLCPLC